MTELRILEQLAMAVSDGSSVDWESARGENAADEPETVLANLQAIDRIASTLRRQPGAIDPEHMRALNESFSDWDIRRREEDAPPLQAGDTWGPLQIRQGIGSGAYAEVYLASDPALERDVALKLFRFRDPDLQQRMLAEGRRLARLDHDNVVRVLGAAEYDGLTGLWMEYLDGENLGQRLEQHGRYSTSEAALAGMDVCKALTAIHGAGLLHRDIKLENLVRTRDGRLVLTDLGAGAEIADELLIQSPGGTPLYLAPEILAGGAASRQSDLYSLGVALYRLSSGQYPYPANNIAELIRAQKHGEVPSLLDLNPGIDPEFAALVSRLLASDSSHRFESAGAVHGALQQLITADSGQTKQRSNIGLFAVAAVLTLATMLGIWQLSEAPRIDTTFRYDISMQANRPGQDAETLAQGATLYLGDSLSMSLALEQPMYVYVFSEDDQGRAYGLYPIAALDQHNPLSAGEPHRLPGTINNRELNWLVDSLAGLEYVHVVLSRERPEDIEREFFKLPAPALPDPASGVFRPRGMGSLTPADSAEAISISPLMQTVRLHTGTAREADSQVHQVFEFRNGGQRSHD